MKTAESYEYLVIDFETVDPYLSLKMGSGWVYKDIKVLGCAFYYPDGKTQYIVTKQSILNKLQKTKTLVVFNANYDIGILKMWGVDIEQYLIIDVLLMSKLYDSSRMSYSLDEQGKDYLGIRKSDEALGDLAKELDLVVSKTQNPVKAAKKHMDKLQEANKELVAEYAKQDALMTYQLYDYFLSKEPKEYYQFEFYSDLLKVTILNRSKGVRIDLLKLLELEAQLQLKLLDAQRKLNNFNQGNPVNCKSPIDVPQLLIKHGINLKMSEKGNYICDKHVLAELGHEVSECILDVRKLYTLKTNFVDKIIEMQRYTIRAIKSEFGSKYLYGFIYPEITILGASATGRCSSSGPNIQQIPSRDGEFAKLIRGIFLPEEGYTHVCSADYSAQEPRLIVNDAYLFRCKDAISIIKQFRADPKTDFHQIACELMELPGDPKEARKVAKTIGLGLLYGMGVKKLALQIGKSVEQASFLRDLYFTKLPFMKTLIDSMSRSLKERGYIKTLLGNKLRLDKEVTDEEGHRRSFEYKAINKRTQGNAANQTNAAQVYLYRNNIPFMFTVHDEVVASVNSTEEAKTIKTAMEGAIKLAIPSVVDINCGNTWGDCK